MIPLRILMCHVRKFIYIYIHIRTRYMYIYIAKLGQNVGSGTMGFKNVGSGTMGV